MRLNQSFYNQPTRKVASQLLGKFLIRKIGNKKIIGEITEVENYIGPNDLASHASRGRTKRTELMFGQGGFWYIYLIYGMYYCLNIVTEHKNYPAAVLLRAVKPISGLGSKMKTDGPGKLCRAFKIDKSLNGKPAFGKNCQLWIEDRGVKILPRQIKKSTRIGVDYAGKYKDKLWRFYISDKAIE
ncbi:MAG: DNA-3-methyladenine glycosylase [Patescibacteria group bacterium]|jgi:DNA-3-methyladenine glycosylase